MRTTAGFADRLIAAMDGASPLCVGLDPVVERLPAALSGSDVERVRAFGLGVVDAVAGAAACVKIQSACYERFGAGGVGLLPELIERARSAGLVVILDAKRGDIGISNAHYAEAAGEADAITVSGYLGIEALEPFVARGLGLFVLVRTSNPEGDGVQTARLADGRRVCEMVAAMVAAYGAGHMGALGLSGVGAVVGLTKAAEGAHLRAAMPAQVFLVPGLGAQGGTADDLSSLRRAGAMGAGAGVLATASRSVIYPGVGAASWQAAIAQAARATADEVAAALS